TGWMMWNWLVSSLAVGASVVLYDGSPLVPTPDVLWNLVDQLGELQSSTAAVFSTSELHCCRVSDELNMAAVLQRCFLCSQPSDPTELTRSVLWATSVKRLNMKSIFNLQRCKSH
ncbi:acetoacetyl-CoA synthetase-like, partial [Tachysurus ichikawai]